MAWHHAATLPDSANSLGGVLLPVGTRWPDQYQFSPYTQTSVVSFNGQRDYAFQRLIAGQIITLDFSFPFTWLYGVKLDALRLFYDSPGIPLTFVWDSQNYDVLLDNENAPNEPALAFEELDNVNGQPISGTRLYTGVIHLITV